jgi:hypothetical protein
MKVYLKGYLNPRPESKDDWFSVYEKTGWTPVYSIESSNIDLEAIIEMLMASARSDGLMGTRYTYSGDTHRLKAKLLMPLLPLMRKV